MTDLTIVNTRAGNLYSLQAALERMGFSVKVADTPDQTDGGQLVIPGQGRFGTVMQHITGSGWVPFLNDWRAAGKNIVGICVGMQIFFEASEEDPGVAGLGWFKGQAARLDFPKKPMVGWADVELTDRHVEPAMPTGAAYFVNSFAIRDSDICIAKTNYGETFCAAVKVTNVSGFQFHPEKSSQYGLALLAWALGKQ